MAEPEDLHEWVSFEDPEEQRTWVFDVTFLTSRWTCIFGRGCKGVLTEAAPELSLGCCSYGAHFTDDDDHKRVVKAAARLTADQWQFQKTALRRGGFSLQMRSGERRTRLVGDACIFLNRPGFPGGAGCALHRAALERGERPLDLKPEVCWQLPIRRVDVTDDNGWVTSTVREWKRRDWGDGGEDFHWWCTESDDAFVGDRPVWREAREELTEMVGAEVYAMLARHLEAREGNGVTFLPHPAVRRR